jgi:Ca-activated chloride channel family protein
MEKLMRCPWCGLLQDEPAGVKVCGRCGGALEYQAQLPSGNASSCIDVQMELDQVAAPADVNTERYLLVTLRTPASIPAEEQAPAGKQRPPLGFTAVLDVSGSMQGEKIDHARQAVRQAVGFLHTGDVFSLVTFSNGVASPIESLPVDQKLPSAVEAQLKRIAAGGQTALCGGLETGIARALQGRRDTDLVLMLSDGQANVGETDLEKIGYRAFQARQQGMIVSSLGVGIDYNEALMAEIATQGGGRFYHVSTAGQIPAYLAGELGEVAALAARDVTLHLELPDGAMLSSLSAAYPVRQSGGQAAISVGDIPADTQLEIVLRLSMTARAPGARLSVQGSLTFRTPAGHDLSMPVNRVTVRFMEQKAFAPRESVVLPVAERVFTQMKATSILGISRVRAARPAQEQAESEKIFESLADYAELLGRDRSEFEMRKMREDVLYFAASPAASKAAIAEAHRSVRGTKDHKS